MQEMKDTLRATVHIGYDGRVYKTFRGPKAEERFANEVRVLRFLEQAGCPFVPRLLEDDAAKLRIVTTNCGSRVQHLGQEKMDQLFAELEQYGVRHDDKDIRNVTYRAADGRFCLIDFEFATLVGEAMAGTPHPDPLPASGAREGDGTAAPRSHGASPAAESAPIPPGAPASPAPAEESQDGGPGEHSRS